MKLTFLWVMINSICCIPHTLFLLISCLVQEFKLIRQILRSRQNSQFQNIQYVRTVLGHACYYRWFIENFTRITTPLFKLLTKDIDFFWDDHCQHDFNILKEKLTHAPILRWMSWSLSFHISNDSSDIDLGDILGHQENQWSYAISFNRKKLTLAELNYTIT